VPCGEQPRSVSKINCINKDPKTNDIEKEGKGKNHLNFGEIQTLDNLGSCILKSRLWNLRDSLDFPYYVVKATDCL
jgi:hypothetical protein